MIQLILINLILIFLTIIQVRSQNFLNNFTLVSEANLETDKVIIGELIDFGVDINNNYIFVDALGKQALIFKNDGKFIQQLGGVGRGPGEYKQPISVSFDQYGNIYIVDNDLRRISKFDSKFSFIKSFIIESTHFVPGFMKIVSDKIYMDAYKENWKKNIPGIGDYIVVYSSNGKYLKSFYPVSNWANENNLGYFSKCSFDIDQKGNIYAVQSTEFIINVLDTNGLINFSFGKQPKYFKQPKPIDDLKSFFKKPQKDIEDFENSFTPIENLILTDDGFVIISVRIPEKLRGNRKEYVIEIYDSKGKHVVGNIETDYKLLCRDKDNNLYFLTKYEERDPSPPIYRIGKFKLVVK
ncbi:MAG: 6-bladed beta-propeller [Bacteroidota bacterium]|nr:6-bladed beta-propeller [Bacteroidota bacterium]